MAQVKDGGGAMAVGSRCALAAQGEDGGGQRSSLRLARVATCAGRSLEGAAALASLASLGLRSWAIVGCWGVSALAGDVGASVVACWRGVSGGVLAGRWCSHSVASGTLVSEEEGPDNQHEGGRGRGERRGERYKG